MSDEYRALVAKVDAFTQAVTARRQADLACSAGCASCCHVWLTVSPVEAEALRGALAELAPEKREHIRERGRRELAREQHGSLAPRCALLDEGGRCSAYAARPLVCRTQGHALRYPQGIVPREAVAQRRANGDVTWCPLNYNAAEPTGADVLDAERVDQILAVIVRRDAATRGVSADTRLSLSSLAAEWNVLHDRTARDDESHHACSSREGSRAKPV